MHLCFEDSQHYPGIRSWFAEAEASGQRFALTQAILAEFLHVATDPRRFEQPLSMPEAIEISMDLWHGPDVERLTLGPEVHSRICDLMLRFRLGRKRVLDTQLAATLELAGVAHLATLNGRDFKIFPFLEVIDPSD